MYIYIIKCTIIYTYIIYTCIILLKNINLINKNHSYLAYLIICVTPGVIKTANSYFVPTRRKECAKTKAPKE